MVEWQLDVGDAAERARDEVTYDHDNQREELRLFAGKRPEQIGVRPALEDVPPPVATPATRPATTVASVADPQATIVQPAASQR